MRSFQHVTLPCTPRMSCCTHTRMSCCTRKWGTAHNASCHTHECVMPHTWMRHATHMNESCRTHGWDVAHTGMSQVTHTHNQRKRKGGCKKRCCQASTSPSRTTIIHSTSTWDWRGHRPWRVAWLASCSDCLFWCTPSSPLSGALARGGGMYIKLCASTVGATQLKTPQTSCSSAGGEGGGVRRRGVSNQKWMEIRCFGGFGGKLAVCCSVLCVMQCVAAVKRQRLHLLLAPASCTNTLQHTHNTQKPCNTL